MIKAQQEAMPDVPLDKPEHKTVLWYVRTTRKSDLVVPQDAALVRAYHTNTFPCITVA
ncbi:hypothetical protein E2C01_094898 [Portunus trituberculatus]|uniref:Uncharacterized protein n=1 Tax=Portunus trituberculatus TaxID=210409 RepID=A0A5B7JTQ2_PORTR|nr:hypothetical protein [Portunus trituberculatus]